jgi:acyl-CoA synthetase (AMP-forming)/AMP-acid ligase II
MNGALPFLLGLIEAARKRGLTLPALRTFACGGAPMPAALLKEAMEVFPNCLTYRGFGSSEVPGLTSAPLSRDDVYHAAETDGFVWRAEVKVLDAVSGALLGPDEEGEFAAKCPQMFLGYLRAEDNLLALDQEGFFLMGDLGRLSLEGWLVVTGRKKDLIVRAGEKISPKEIEDIVLSHPQVIDVAIVAMPDARTGEAACMFVLPTPGATVTLDEITAFISQRGVARQKLPERLEIVTDFPRTESGKIRKNVLRDWAKALARA